MFEHELAGTMGLSKKRMIELRSVIRQGWEDKSGRGIWWTTEGIEALRAHLTPGHTKPAMKYELMVLAKKKPAPVKLIPRRRTLNASIVEAEIPGRKGLVRLAVRSGTLPRLGVPVWCRLRAEPDLYELHPDRRQMAIKEASE